jgi:hypothetical protein
MKKIFLAIILLISTFCSAQLTISTTSTGVLCRGGASGTGTVQASGGTTPYSYVWNANSQTNATATGLSIGIYTVTVTDSNSNTAISSATITEPTSVVAVITNVSSVSCNGTSDGSAMATGSGGTPGYTYLWSNAETTQTATNLSGGISWVTITDSNGCSTTAATSIIQPSPIQITSLNTIDIPCKGDSTGYATISVQGGNPVGGYYSQWSGTSQMGFTVTGLAAGNHTVTISDINSCNAVGNFTINEPLNALTGYLTHADALCFGSATGELGAVIQGGTANPSVYGFLWNTTPAQTTVVADSLLVGTYSVTVTDDNACALILTNNVNQPSQIQTTTTVLQNITCFGNSDGIAIIDSTIGGMLPYHYLWSNGQTDTIATGLSTGLHSVTVTDANACTSTATANITQGIVITSANESCHNTGDGSATATTSYGASITWEQGGSLFDTSSIITGLSAGIYHLSVIDTNGCTFNDTIIITNPDTITIFATNNDNGTASTFPIGGTPPYSYLWDTNANSQNTSTAINLTGNTTYSVTVTDSLGCSSVDMITVSVGIEKIEKIERFDLYPNPSSGIFYIDILLQKEEEIKLEVRDVLGKVIWVKEFKGKHIKPLANLSKIPNGVYFVTLKIKSKVETKIIKIIR